VLEERGEEEPPRAVRQVLQKAQRVVGHVRGQEPVEEDMTAGALEVLVRDELGGAPLDEKERGMKRRAPSPRARLPAELLPVRRSPADQLEEVDQPLDREAE